jgi:hypothetical protein
MEDVERRRQALTEQWNWNRQHRQLHKRKGRARKKEDEFLNFQNVD